MLNKSKIEEVKAMESIEDVRHIAKGLNISFSGNSGIDTLKSKIIDELGALPLENEELTPPDVEFIEEDVIEVAKAIPSNRHSIKELLEMNPNEVEDVNIRRQAIRAQKMRLHRVRVTSLDPADSALEGTIVTVYNKYLGKVSKFVPFGEAGDNGYHVEEVLLNTLRNKKFAMRKEKKGEKFGVKKYNTVMTPKYSIEELPPLTKEEVKALAQRQSAANAIG